MRKEKYANVNGLSPDAAEAPEAGPLVRREGGCSVHPVEMCVYFPIEIAVREVEAVALVAELVLEAALLASEGGQRSPRRMTSCWRTTRPERMMWERPSRRDLREMMLPVS